MIRKISVVLCAVLLSAANLFANETVANEIQSNSSLITKVDDNYIMGNKTMTKEQYLDFIKGNCAEAWESYQKGNRIWKAGWGLLGAGIGTFVAGTSVYCIGAYDYYKQNKKATPYNQTMSANGIIVMCVGSALMTGSIPCLIVGGIKRNNSHEVYNEVITRNATAINFGIQPSSNGLAMVMQF
jgi:hypothetical protein